MSYHPRIETAYLASFQTTRSRNSELWFIQNPKLEQAVLGRLAKISSRYGALVYAFAIEGNHVQFPGHFPGLNRADFMRDLNSAIATMMPFYVPSYDGGRFWGRRYSNEFVPFNDLEESFFYTVLQPVQDGLVKRISEYPWYNCFHDAVWGIERKFKVVRRREFNAARKRNSQVNIKDYTDVFVLKYQRLPGYEHLSQREYALMMGKKLEERRQVIVEERLKAGLGFLGREKLLRIKPGSKPRSTKTSTESSHRPRILSRNPEQRRAGLDWYFTCYILFKDASRRYRRGELNAEFPPGMYRPYYRPPPVTLSSSP
jgi:hypothetical protein